MKRKPNIILIFADDLGYGDVSCFNENSKIHTRNIDSLAESGMKFKDSHATSALCTPSRYGLLTGRYNWRSRLKSYVIPGDSDTLIERDRKTIAHIMKDSGYRTAAVGKWHLGLEWTYKEGKDFKKFSLDPDNFEDHKYQFGRGGVFDPSCPFAEIEGLDIDYEKPIKYGPNDYGFDYFFGTSASLDQPPYVYIENSRIIGNPAVLSGLPDLDRAEDSQKHAWQMGPAAIGFVNKQVPVDMQNKVMELLDEFTDSDQPYFLYYPVHLVHGPLLPSDEFKGQSGIGDYGDFVLQLDHYVGQIIDILKAKDQFEDTVVIFTSDNGASGVAGFEELAEHGHNPSYHFKGKKADIWEGGHREPTIISYPREIEGGTETEQMTSHSDIYRTLANLLGAEVPEDAAEDSYSLIPVLKGERKSVREDIVHSSGNGGFSIRRGYWKLNLVAEGGGFDASYSLKDETKEDTHFRPCELFDLRDDISETENIIDKHPEVVKELKDALTEYIKRGRSTEGAAQKNQPNWPSGNWKQIYWMDGYDEYIDELNSSDENNEE